MLSSESKFGLANKPYQNITDHIRGSRGGGTGGTDPHPPHLENHKAIGFLSNIGPDPLENHKATKPAFNIVMVELDPI